MPKRRRPNTAKEGRARAPRFSAGVVVVRCMEGVYRYLLLRAYGYWDFPKGLVEPDETPLAAAQREAREEAGLSDLDFRWGHGYFETDPYGGKIARYYLAASPAGDVRLGVNRLLGRPEHHGFLWADREAARRRLGTRVRAALDWAHDVIGDDCREE